MSTPGASLAPPCRRISRWKIECLFRDLKQFLSFGKLPAGGKEAADLAVCMPFMIYTSLHLDPLEFWGLEKKETLGVMIQRLREKGLMQSFDLIIGNKDHKKVLKFKARRESIHRKPRDKHAGNKIAA